MTSMCTVGHGFISGEELQQHVGNPECIIIEIDQQNLAQVHEYILTSTFSGGIY